MEGKSQSRLQKALHYLDAGFLPKDREHILYLARLATFVAVIAASFLAVGFIIGKS